MGLFKLLEWLTTGNTYASDRAANNTPSYRHRRQTNEDEPEDDCDPPPKKSKWYAPKAPDKNQTRCVFCGSKGYGTGCGFSQLHSKKQKNGFIHVHEPDGKHCVYCGSTSYGSGCGYSPTGFHSRYH